MQKFSKYEGSSHDKFRNVEWYALKDVLSNVDANVIRGNLGSIHSIVLSPHGRRLAAASLGRDPVESIVCLFDPVSRECIREVRIPDTNHHRWAAFSPSSSELFVTVEQSIEVWDAETGDLRRMMEVNMDEGERISAIDVDGARNLVVGGSQGSIFIVDSEAGSTTRLPGRQRRIWDLDLSPDGGTIAATSVSNEVVLIDVKSREQQVLVEDALVMTVEFSEDGKRVIFGGSRRQAAVWDLGGAEPAKLFELPTQIMFGAKFLSDGTLVTAGVDRGISIWDRHGKLMQRLRGHDGTPLALCTVEKDGFLYSADSVGTIRRWSKPQPRSEYSVEDICILGFLKNELYCSKVFHYGSKDGKGEISRINLETGSRTVMATPATPETFLPAKRGNQFFTASRNGTVSLWDATDFSVLDQIHLSVSATSWHETPPTICQSLDGAHLAVTAPGPDKVWVYLHEVESRALLETDRWPANDFPSICVFSPDGTRLLTASMDNNSDGEINVWDVRNGKLLNSWIKSNGGTKAFFFVGNDVLLTLDYSMLRSWNPMTGQQIGEAIRLRQPYRASLSHDKKRIAIGTKEGSVQLWDLASKREVAILQQSGPPIYSMRFSPDGAKLVAMTDNGQLQVWTLE